MISFIIYFIVIFFSFLCVHTDNIPKLGAGREQISSLYQTKYSSALEKINQNDYHAAVQILEGLVSRYPSDAECLQLLGTLKYTLGDVETAIHYLKMGLDNDESGWSMIILPNYIEALRGANRIELAREVGLKAMQKIPYHPYPEASAFYNNLGIIESALGNYQNAVKLYTYNTQLDPKNYKAWRESTITILKSGDFNLAISHIEKAITHYPNDNYLYFSLGVAHHLQNRLHEAYHFYKISEALNSTDVSTTANIAAVLHMLGRSDESLNYYLKALSSLPEDASIRNNIGALLGTMNRKEEELHYLLEAYALDPLLEHTLVNLGGYYQDEGLLEQAKEYLQKADEKYPSNFVIPLRLALMLSPVCKSWAQMLAERHSMESSINDVMYQRSLNKEPKSKLLTSVDRIHFYIQYHGLNDRLIQERVVEAYNSILYDVNITLPNIHYSIDNILATDNQGTNSSFRKVKIGFMSKFLGLFEPHGLLLEGVIRYLPRTVYQVIVLAVARTDGKKLAPSIQLYADEIHDISLNFAHAFETVSKLQLDILVFADVLSEPINHFLSQSRLASIQMAFWGNPITSGSQHIDYFISADEMEHPYRTKMSKIDEPYTEQVVLMEGQGIWYATPVPIEQALLENDLAVLIESARDITRESFGLKPDWFIFLVPQSVFKIHPLYDDVLARILLENPEAHLVVTGGRRPIWTLWYKERLIEALNKLHSDLMNRFHLIERVSSEKFQSLIEIADVVLHPFPFDGSRTSADALTAYRPFVTLPTEYLRGRMGVAFYRTMNIPELVARNVDEYVSIASRLYSDKSFYSNVQEKIKENLYLIWEDMEVPYSWCLFLTTLFNVPINRTFEAFVQQTGRNAENEVKLRNIRNTNRKLFVDAWGTEQWLLDWNGKAPVENNLSDATQWPRIFRNWDNRPTQKLNQTKEIGLDIKIGFNTSDNELAHTNLSWYKIFPDISKQCKILIRTGEINKAFELLSSLYTTCQDDPLYLIDLGGTELFRGNYQEAAKYCVRAIQHFSRASLAYACIGVAGTYFDSTSENTLNALLNSLILIDLNKQRRTGANHTTVPLDLKSQLFSISKDVVESNLLTYFRVNRRYHTCVKTVIELYHLPPMEHGGAHVIMFAVFDWQPKHESLLNELEAALRQRGEWRSLSCVQDHNDCLNNASLVNEIHRYQFIDPIDTVPIKTMSYYHNLQEKEVRNVVNIALECLQAILDNDEYLGKVTRDFLSLMETIRSDSDKQLVNHFEMDIDKISLKSLEIINDAIDLRGINPFINEIFHQIIQNNLNQLLPIDTRQSPEGVPPAAAAVAADNVGTASGSNNPIVLIMQYFQPEESQRLHEIQTVLMKNLGHYAIDAIVLLNEIEFDFSNMIHAHKIHQFIIGKRLTFRMAFEFANEFLSGCIVIIANSDIYFDKTLYQLKSLPIPSSPTEVNITMIPTTPPASSIVLAMLKWIHENDSISLNLRTDSQDAWIFRSPLPFPTSNSPVSVVSTKEIFYQLIDFSMGVPRCDNRLANILIQFGYPVMNPIFSLHIIEMHQKRINQKLYDSKQSIHGSMSNVLISDIEWNL